ncbi:glycosyltransferase [Gymnodinialimonas sp. 2305UL16-5]|uniref:glycosyltransferase n=1 Tax=Gymnodinialimonas mytili TaxID=3126503 RepID=UPI0030955318
MKICFSVTSFPLLSQTFVLSQVLYAVRDGHEVTVACSSIGPSAALSEDQRDALRDVKVVQWPPSESAIFDYLPIGLKNRIAARRSRDAWRRLIDADLIIAHFGYRGATVARAQHDWPNRPPLVTFFHGRDVSVEFRRNKLKKYQNLFADGDLFLTVNRAFADRLLEGGAPSARVRPHHLGIPVSRYTFSQSPRQTPLRLVSVCRLVEKKGINVALDALAKLSKDHPEIDWCFDIGGDGPLEPDLRDQANRLGIAGHVEFLGPLKHDETLRRIAEADIMLLPSVTAPDGDQEGIPVTLMEAMALGTAVCTTRHSGIPELVTHGETGLLSDEHDAACLAANIYRLASAEGPDLTQAARQKVERDFNEDRQNALLLDLCRDLIAHGFEDQNSSAAENK